MSPLTVAVIGSAAVNALGDDADHLWAEPRGAEVIPFPARLRALR